MTMPAERTLATLNTLKFLHELISRNDIPDEVKLTAQGLARHFPTASDIQFITKAMAKETNPFFEEMFCLDDILLGQQLKEAFLAVKKYN